MAFSLLLNCAFYWLCIYVAYSRSFCTCDWLEVYKFSVLCNTSISDSLRPAHHLASVVWARNDRVRHFNAQLYFFCASVRVCVLTLNPDCFDIQFYGTVSTSSCHFYGLAHGHDRIKNSVRHNFHDIKIVITEQFFPKFLSCIFIVLCLTK